MSVTKKIITITIDQDYYRILKQRKIRVSTLIHRLLTKYLTEEYVGYPRDGITYLEKIQSNKNWILNSCQVKEEK